MATVDMSLQLVFKALAEPTRREILRLLRREDMTAGKIAEHFTIAKPSLSHHLNLLKQAGLVADERRGQNKVYSLNTTVFQDVMTWAMDFMGEKGDEEQKTKGNQNQAIAKDLVGVEKSKEDNNYDGGEK